MRADIEARGVAAERLMVVPNAVDPSFLEPLPSGAGVRARRGIGAEEFVVGTTTSCFGFRKTSTCPTLRSPPLTSPRSATSTHSACTARANTSPIQEQCSYAPQRPTITGATDAVDTAGRETP